MVRYLVSTYRMAAEPTSHQQTRVRPRPQHAGVSGAVVAALWASVWLGSGRRRRREQAVRRGCSCAPRSTQAAVRLRRTLA